LLPFNRLQPGDIVVTSGSGDWQSKIIEWFTSSPWTHVFLVRDTETLIESTFPKGVCRADLPARELELIKNEQAWRVRRYPELEPEQLAEILKSADSMVGRRYDILQAVLFGLFHRFIDDGPKRTICSRFITAVYKAGAINLFPDAIVSALAGKKFYRYAQLAKGWTIPQDFLQFADLEEVL
jgi:hypothetical protein